MFPLSDLNLLAPELILAIGGMVALVAGLFVPSQRAIVVMCCVVLLGAMVGLYMQHDMAGTPIFGGELRLTLFSQGMKFALLAVTIMVMVMSHRKLAVHGLGRFEYPVLMVFATLGMFIMLSAQSYLSLYLGFELQSLSLYVLTAFAREDSRAAEAGAKYFILGALASGFILFGASLLYGATGSLSYGAPVVNEMGFGVGMAFMLAGIAFKLSLAPFHMWTPDVYDGAPMPVTAYFALAPKIAGLGALIILLSGPFMAFSSQWTLILLCLGTLSLVLGSFAGLRQSNLKRLLAYSTIANIGTLMLAVSVAAYGAALNYLFIYIIMSGVIFAALLGLSKDDQPLEKIEDLAGLSRSHPFTAWSLTAALFALAGIPPLAGFFAKFMAFKAVIAAGYTPIAVLGIVASVVAAGYYLRLIKLMFFDAPPEEALTNDNCLARRAVLVVLLAVTLLLVLFPDAIGGYVTALLPGLK